MWFQVKAYFQFLAKSTNQHGVHSPFVFDFVTKCFYDTKFKEIYQTIHQYRAELLQNHTTIHVQDFGTGSRVFKSNERKISAIAKNAGITKKRAELLARIVNYFQIKNALEIGTSLGMATIAMKNVQLSVITLEGCPETAKIAQQQFTKHKLSHVNLLVGEFAETIPKVTEKTFDLIYLDGNHQKEATLAYFEQLLPTMHNDTVLIIDDIHWSASMQAAWEAVKAHPRVTVTIDTFFWGLVFFRKEQAKEHFIVRL